MTPDLVEQFHLVDHIRAYEFSKRSNYLRKRTEDMYLNPDMLRLIFIAFNQGKAVGSLIVKQLPDGFEKDEYAKRFWQRLNSNLLLSRDMTRTACHIAGISVLPEYQNQGIGTKLLQNATEELDQAIVAGGSKSAKLVTVQSNGLAPLGYRTFFGMYEVTPGMEGIFTKIHQPILDAYLYCINHTDIVYSSRNLPKGIPDTTTYSERIQTAFKPLAERIISQGEAEGALIQPVLSIKQEILNPN